MRVYRPASHWMDDDRLNVPSVTIIEPERGWRKTGLYDQHGVELMANEHRGPVGFVTQFKS